MRIVIASLIFFCIVLYLHRQAPSQNNVPRPITWDRVLHPFDQRVHYRIGQIDPRFAITQSQLIQLAKQAANIWHQGTGRILFVYDENALLTINLMYDNRQAETDQQQAEQHILDQQQHIQEDKLHDFQQQQIQLEKEAEQLKIQQATFTDRLTNYNHTVQAWNTLGHLDDFNRQQLAQQRNLLDAEQQQLQRSIDTYNQHVHEFNAMSAKLRDMATRYNQMVDQYRAHVTPREFEKGVYNGQQINIYEFTTPADLRLTIAHELGHALGLKHNNDPYALMYPVLKQQNIENFQLTATDRNMLAQP